MAMNSTHDIVVYYWTNLVSNKNLNTLEQQRSEFQHWLHDTKENPTGATLKVQAEFIDTHLKRTKPKNFPELEKAVKYCTDNNCRLIIARLDGLISQEKFSSILANEKLDFFCIDKQLVTPAALSVVRQYVSQQSKQHSASIKRGLKLTSHKLGNPNAAKAISPFNKIKTENSVLFALLLQPVIAEFSKKNLSQRKMVDALNESGILAPEGGKWVLSQLQKVLKRIELNDSALDLTHKIEKNHYGSYSAHDLINALNQHQAQSEPKPSSRKEMNWDEKSLNSAQTRNHTINNVLELYDFMQHHQTDINKHVSAGWGLEKIAEELNTKQLPPPKALYLDDLATTQNQQGPIAKWDAKLVEELLKRLDNQLKLTYSAPAKDLLLQALIKYNADDATPEANTIVNKVYAQPVLKKLIH